MNQAVRYVTPMVRSNCLALKPFLDEQSRYQAMSHLLSGTFDRSKIVPTFTVNFSWQSPHSYRPPRIFFALFCSDGVDFLGATTVDAARSSTAA